MNIHIAKAIADGTVKMPITVIGSMFAGVGIAFNVERDTYSHIPLAVLFPMTYAGYQIYRNRDEIRAYVGK